MPDKVTYKCECGNVIECVEDETRHMPDSLKCSRCGSSVRRENELVEVRFIDGIERINVYIPYDEHNPSRNPLNMTPRPGHVLLLRHPFPEEKTRAGVVIPATKKDRHGQPLLEYHSNCGRVIAVTDGCWLQPGDYAVWAQRVPVSEEYYRKPQPVIGYYDPVDRFPTLWTLDDKYATCKITHAGDPEWVTVEDGDVVTVLGMTGRRFPVDVKHLKTGEVFDVNGGDLWTTFGLEDRDEEKGTTRVFAAPYDGLVDEDRT